MFSNSVRCFCYIRRLQPLKYAIRFRHKLKTNPPTQASADVVKYLETLPYYEDIKENIPKSLLRKYKTPESMYLVQKSTAIDIVSTLKEHLVTNSPIVEVNPGFGFLTEELLKLQIDQLHLYEISNHFSHFMDELQKKYPGRVNYKVADFFGMWKLAFQDKMDNGTRLKDLMEKLATDDNDRIVKVVGAMPGLSFVKHLINTIIFHNTSNQLGRPDLYITMSGHHFDFLTDKQIKDKKHKSIPALFQLLFDYKLLTKIPKVYYLPWTHPVESKKISLVEENFLYLVNITKKEKLPCSCDHLPLLWYFFKPHMISKTTRVIPMLEQWIPGCGVWLITGQDPPDTNKELGPAPDDALLPHMTIFTEFGDLTLQQKITVFKKFISWPEFEQCPFRVTMENNLPKFISAIDIDKDSIGTHIDDDMDDTSDTSDAEN